MEDYKQWKLNSGISDTATLQFYFSGISFPKMLWVVKDL